MKKLLLCALLATTAQAAEPLDCALYNNLPLTENNPKLIKKFRLDADGSRNDREATLIEYAEDSMSPKFLVEVNAVQNKTFKLFSDDLDYTKRVAALTGMSVEEFGEMYFVDMAIYDQKEYLLYEESVRANAELYRTQEILKAPFLITHTSQTGWNKKSAIHVPTLVLHCVKAP